MTVSVIEEILRQADEAGFVKQIYFEGGEPFLYYPVLYRGVMLAAQAGYETDIVTNAYWATSEQDALLWLSPLAPYLNSILVSSDLFHYSEKISQNAHNANRAAAVLGISSGISTVAQPEDSTATDNDGSTVMYRGRAAEKLSGRAAFKPWENFQECPHEDLRDPGRVHIDPMGNIHICQGVLVGNLFKEPLRQLCAEFAPESHPILQPLLKGGPARLVREYQLEHQDGYADACHLCYSARLALRIKYPELLAPDQVYGVF